MKLFITLAFLLSSTIVFASAKDRYNCKDLETLQSPSPYATGDAVLAEKSNGRRDFYAGLAHSTHPDACVEKENIITCSLYEDQPDETPDFKSYKVIQVFAQSTVQAKDKNGVMQTFTRASLKSWSETNGHVSPVYQANLYCSIF